MIIIPGISLFNYYNTIIIISGIRWMLCLGRQAGGGVDQTGYSVFTGIFYQCCERYRETREEKCDEETFRDGERVEGLLEFSIINDNS